MKDSDIVSRKKILFSDLVSNVESWGSVSKDSDLFF